jgi:hypothetical protein
MGPLSIPLALKPRAGGAFFEGTDGSEAGSRIHTKSLEPDGTRTPVPNYGFRKWNFHLAAGGQNGTNSP